jgi:polyisoprenoid-binding protein YceI
MAENPMRLLTCTLILLSGSGLLALASPESASASSPRAVSAEAETYSVDGVHSNILFKVRHNDVSYFYGRFGDISGTFTFDGNDASECFVAIEVKAESVDTRNKKLDQHLRSPDFFDAKQFPVIIFESTEVAKGEGDVYKVTGDLSLHGVTKSITIDMEHVGTAEGRRGKLMGFHTTFTVDRTDFGMDYGVGSALGSDVEMTISVEAGKE